MNRKKLNRKQIENVYQEYTRVYSKLMKRSSKLTDEERIRLTRQFNIGYKVAEHYHFYKNTVDEEDVFFIIAESMLIQLKKIDKQVNRK